MKSKSKALYARADEEHKYEYCCTLSRAHLVPQRHPTGFRNKAASMVIGRLRDHTLKAVRIRTTMWASLLTLILKKLHDASESALKSKATLIAIVLALKKQIDNKKQMWLRVRQMFSTNFSMDRFPFFSDAACVSICALERVTFFA